jgi:gluconokinase
MRVVVSPDKVVPPEGLWLYLIDTRRALLGGALSEGGNVFAWLRRTFRLPAIAELEAEMLAIAPASHGLTVLPMLAGERSPGWHADAKMTITGLSHHSTPAEIARAALESVAFQLSHIYEQLTLALADQAPQWRLCASGSALLKSALLPQILADTLNCPLELSSNSEASARGVALLALEALGILPDLAQLAPQPQRILQPDVERHAIYSQACERQQRLYDLFF